MHTQPIEQVARFAAQSAILSGDLRRVRLQLVGDAAAALFVLFLTTMLSVYKPWGLTPYGVRRHFTAFPSRMAIARASSPGRYVLWAIAAFVLLVAVLHLFGVGLQSH